MAFDSAHTSFVSSRLEIVGNAKVVDSSKFTSFEPANVVGNGDRTPMNTAVNVSTGTGIGTP